jgi:hypothetical protein
MVILVTPATVPTTAMMVTVVTMATRLLLLLLLLLPLLLFLPLRVRQLARLLAAAGATYGNVWQYGSSRRWWQWQWWWMLF